MARGSRKRYTCPVTKKSVDLPHTHTASPYRLLGCSPEDKKHPECSQCDFSHKCSEWLPPVPRSST